MSDDLHKRGAFYFLISLILLLLLYPLFEGSLISKIIRLSISIIVTLMAVVSLSQNKRNEVIAILLAIPAVVTRVIELAAENDFTTLISLVSGTIFYFFVTIIILSYVLRRKVITTDHIFGAIAAYLLFGILWASLYQLIEIVSPGSFYAETVRGTLDWKNMTYYSFVTLTTLGHGDIIPLSATAMTLTYLESASGVLYVAVLIARLVGVYSGKEQK
jgi:hypothetical protein